MSRGGEAELQQRLSLRAGLSSDTYALQIETLKNDK